MLQRLRAGGTTILLVEQMVERALDIADHAYVLQNGTVMQEVKIAYETYGRLGPDGRNAPLTAGLG